jgi:NTP pyrophosphatase (non-canonical NTP hydrolase)
MTFDDYMEAAQKTAIYPNKGSNPYYAALGLGEAGEIQNQVKKIMRDDNGVITPERKKAVSKELGDLLWYVAMNCYEFNLSMDAVAQGNLVKLSQRKEAGTIKGDGDER